MDRVNFDRQKVEGATFFKNLESTKTHQKFQIQLQSLQYLDLEIIHVKKARVEEDKFLIVVDRNKQTKRVRIFFRVNQTWFRLDLYRFNQKILAVHILSKLQVKMTDSNLLKKKF